MSGRSYAEAGFSTQTVLPDLASGDVVADLDTDHTVLRNGSERSEIDFNFWGVTFLDDLTFYATPGTGGTTFLVQGDIPASTSKSSTRASSVLRCCRTAPVSPTSNGGHHRASGGPSQSATSRRARAVSLAEQRNVDDQVLWLDDDTIAHGLPRPESDTWIVPADGGDAAELLVPRAWSTVRVD